MMNALETVSAEFFEADVLGPSRSSAVHDYMVLAFFTGGSARMEQGETFDVRAGDAYLVPAGERHRLVEARSPEAWGIRFSPSCYAPTELSPLLEPFTCAASGASKVVSIPGDRHAHLASLCAELRRERAAGVGRAHVELVTKSLLGLILAEVSRASPTAADAGSHMGVVRDALRYIERHCLEPISLGDVAAFVRRSPSHVSTSLRRATGKSVVAWIIAGRLAEARRRLLHTDERVDIIAERVGYTDVTHFIRLFRRAHDCTPAAWRARAHALPALVR